MSMMTKVTKGNLTDHLLFISLTVYVMGFFITNFYLSPYYNSTLIKADYILVGSLWVLLAMLFLFVTFYGIQTMRAFWTVKILSYRLAVFICSSFLLLILLAYPLIIKYYREKTISSIDQDFLFAFFAFLGVALLQVLVFYLFKFIGEKSKNVSREAMNYLYLIFFIVSSFVSSGVYSITVYPQLPKVVGGANTSEIMFTFENESYEIAYDLGLVKEELGDDRDKKRGYGILKVLSVGDKEYIAMDVDRQEYYRIPFDKTSISKIFSIESPKSIRNHIKKRRKSFEKKTGNCKKV